MAEQKNQELQADSLMWVGDYETAYKYYEVLISDKKEIVNIEDYYLYYKFIICSIYTERNYSEYKNTLYNIHEIHKNNIKDIRLELEGIQKRISKLDFKSIYSLYEKYFYENTSFLYLLSPRSIVTNLNKLEKKKKQLVIPDIIENGIYKISISSEFNSLLIKGYTEVHINLNNIIENEDFTIIKKYSDVIYLYSKEMNLVSSIYGNGRVMARYLIRTIEDKMSEKSILKFFEVLNSLLHTR